MGPPGEGRGEGGGFEAAEVGFAMTLEKLGDGGSGALLEVGVEIEEGPADAGCEDAAYGGLARAHESGEDDAAKMGGDGGEFRFGQRVWLGGRHCLSLV